MNHPPRAHLPVPLIRLSDRDGARVHVSTDGYWVRLHLHDTLDGQTRCQLIDLDRTEADLLAAALATRHHPRPARQLTLLRFLRRIHRA
ncbi:hypothetical protein ACWF9G_27295 [Nocardia sp. NPDC055029]